MAKVRKYILSIDGGGFRGLAPLIILHHIMQLLVDDPSNERVLMPCKVFDLICGTSAGGIVAILLGRLGLDCSEAISIYKDLGQRIFGMDQDKVWNDLVAGRQFSTPDFEAFLAEVVERYTGSATAALKIGSSNPDAVEHPSTDVFVMTVPAGTGSAALEAYRLRSYTTPPGETDALEGHTWTIAQAARVSLSLHMYFPPLQIGSQAFQDAIAFGFNNPTMEALAEAAARWDPEHHEFVVVNLGTGMGPLFRNNDEDVMNTVREKLGSVHLTDGIKRLMEVVLSVAKDSELRHLDVTGRFTEWMRPDDYFRFNPPEGLDDLDFMDYVNEGTVIENTNAWLKTPSGKDTIRAAYEKLKPAYKARKN